MSPRRPDRDDEGKGAAATRGRNSQKEGTGSGSTTAPDRGEQQWFSNVKFRSFKTGRPCRCLIEM